MAVREVGSGRDSEKLAGAHQAEQARYSAGLRSEADGDRGRRAVGARVRPDARQCPSSYPPVLAPGRGDLRDPDRRRSEEHTSELQSLMRISYAVFCLKKKKNTKSRNEVSTRQLHNNNQKVETQY